MARRLRLILPGVAVHVIQRGVNRVPCFRVEADYLVYLSLLRQLTSKYACAVHAYWLMTNHVPLLLTPSTTQSCTALMRDLGRSYVRYFNRRHERTGTLWEGRFRSCIVESAEYVLACYRYIELNPVRAGMVPDASAYPWSSHAVNTGTRADAIVVPHCEYTALAVERANLHASYRQLFEQAFDDALLKVIRDATNGGYPLVSESFKSRMTAPPGCRTERGRPGPRAAAE